MRRRSFIMAAGGAAWFRALSAPGPRVPPHPLRTREERSGTRVLVKVLGTAQDGGIPHPGCSCPNCERARREPGSARLIASLAVVDPEEKVVFIVDATPDFRPQLDLALGIFGPDPPPLKEVLGGILLTHAHIGHYAGLVFFGTEALSMKGLPVYCSGRMGDFLRDNGPWSQLVRLGNIELRSLVPGETLPLAQRITVNPVLVPHRDEYTDTLGLTIAGPRKGLLYIPDIQSWEAWGKSLAEELDKVEFALLDGTFFSPGELPGRDLSAIGHPLIEASLALMGRLPPEKREAVFFTHLNHSNPALDPDGEARRKIEQAGFHLASEGQVYLL